MKKMGYLDYKNNTSGIIIKQNKIQIWKNHIPAHFHLAVWNT